MLSLCEDYNSAQPKPNQHQTKNHHGGPRGLGAAPVVVVVVVVCVVCGGALQESFKQMWVQCPVIIIKDSRKPFLG